MSNERQCRKVRYEGKKDALTALNLAMRRRRNPPAYLRAYPCPNCNGWHLTHQRPRNQDQDHD